MFYKPSEVLSIFSGNSYNLHSTRLVVYDVSYNKDHYYYGVYVKFIFFTENKKCIQLWAWPHNYQWHIRLIGDGPGQHGGSMKAAMEYIEVLVTVPLISLMLGWPPLPQATALQLVENILT